MAIPNLVVVFLCVIVAGAVVIVGAAFGKQFLPGNRSEEAAESRDWTQMPPEQLAYCRMTVQNNLTDMIAQLRHEVAQPQSGYDTSSGYGPSSTVRTGAYMHGRYSNQHSPAQMHTDPGR